MDNTLKNFIKFMKIKFYGRLEKKTGWGRNEIREIFNESIADALTEDLNN